MDKNSSSQATETRQYRPTEWVALHTDCLRGLSIFTGTSITKQCRCGRSVPASQREDSEYAIPRSTAAGASYCARLSTPLPGDVLPKSALITGITGQDGSY